MPAPIALAAAAIKGAKALKAASTVAKGAQAAGTVAKGVQGASTVAKGAQTLSSASSAVNGAKTTAGLLKNMSSLADGVSSKAGAAHQAMGDIVSRNDKSVTPDLGQSFEAVKPGRSQEPLSIGNTPGQNQKSEFMKGFDIGMNNAEGQTQQAPSGPGM